MNRPSEKLPPLSDKRSIAVEVDVGEMAAFSEMLNEFFFGKRYHAIAEAKKANQATQIESLRRLYDLTIRHWKTGQAHVVARFLACLYDGSRFQFDLTDFRSLDSEIVEHCIHVLRLDSRPERGVHCHIERGGELWEKMIADYGLEAKVRVKA